MEVGVYHLLAALGGILFVIATARSVRAGSQWLKSWQWALLATILFASWTAYAIGSSGPFGFWKEHSRGVWSIQIWFDLLFAAALGWILLLPRAGAMGMSPWPWLILTFCTGSVGLGAMMARCLYLEDLDRTAGPHVRRAI